jgi:hypothetical protein
MLRFGELHAHYFSMIAQNIGSEPGSLVLIGGCLLAASIIMRRVLTALFRAFSRAPKPSFGEQESPLK